MSMRNWVAKNMNNYNKPSVVPDKRSKHLDDILDEELDTEQDLWDDEDQYRGYGEK